MYYLYYRTILYFVGSTTRPHLGLKDLLDERTSIMNHENDWHSSAIFSSDRTRLHALELHIVRSIAERYGARVQADSETKAIKVSFQGTQGDCCCLELEAQLCGMYDYVSTLVESLAMGKIPLCIVPN
jgi:hypothetical protein